MEDVEAKEMVERGSEDNCWRGKADGGRGRGEGRCSEV